MKKFFVLGVSLLALMSFTFAFLSPNAAVNEAKQLQGTTVKKCFSGYKLWTSGRCQKIQVWNSGSVFSGLNQQYANTVNSAKSAVSVPTSTAPLFYGNTGVVTPAIPVVKQPTPVPVAPRVASSPYIDYLKAQQMNSYNQCVINMNNYRNNATYIGAGQPGKSSSTQYAINQQIGLMEQQCELIKDNVPTFYIWPEGGCYHIDGVSKEYVDRSICGE